MGVEEPCQPPDEKGAHQGQGNGKGHEQWHRDGAEGAPAFEAETKREYGQKQFEEKWRDRCSVLRSERE
jgi:hypothetical protein